MIYGDWFNAASFQKLLFFGFPMNKPLGSIVIDRICQIMDQIKSEIEIQAVNLAQQWYSLPKGHLPNASDLLSKYLCCFTEPADQQLFLKETLRIIDELVKGPKEPTISPQSVEAFKNAIKQHIHS